MSLSLSESLADTSREEDDDSETETVGPQLFEPTAGGLTQKE